MDEFTTFSVMVARIKADYRADDSYTNLGILFSPTIDIPKPDNLSVDLSVTTSMAKEPITFSVDGE